jgi:PAS domain S-box-containing protein
MKIKIFPPGKPFNPDLKSQLREFEGIINQIPLPIILLDIDSFLILKSNNRASKPIGIHTRRIENHHVGEFLDITQLSKLISNPGTSTEKSILLQRPSGEPLKLVMNTLTLAQCPNIIGLILQPAELSLGSFYEIPSRGNLFQKFTPLINLLEISEQENVFQLFIEEFAQITGAGLVALYLGDEEQPVFKRIASKDALNIFPSEIISNEISINQNPYLWQPGFRTTPLTFLTIIARSKHLSYLASIPITRSGALIGLLILADTSHLPVPEILSIGKFLAEYVYSFVEVKVKFSSLRQELFDIKTRAAKYFITREFIREGLIELSSDLTIRNLNSAAVSAFGYSLQEVQGKPVELILISNESLKAVIEKARQGSNIITLDRTRLFRRNGEDFLSKLRLLPVSEGDSKAVIILVEDLSEQERIRIQTEELERRAELGEVMATFAHEVRNPINNISTGLQWMSRNLAQDHPNQVEIARLLQDCDRLAELMKMVLSLSKQSNYTMEAIDLTTIFKRLINRRLTRLETTGIKYELQILPEPPLVMGDLRALEQVFTNLINNSIQAMSETGGNLVIRVQMANQAAIPDQLTSNDMVEVSIADTGPGIPNEIQDKIFQPFFTTNSVGTGLGLTIVKRIVSLHKGLIKLESFPGGTIFRVFLPVYLPVQYNNSE